MDKIKNKKTYIIDPEPLMPLKRSLILLGVIFIISTILIAILKSVMNPLWISLIIEIGVYMIPIVFITLIFRYSLNDISRIRNIFRIDLNLIVIFSTIFMALIASELSLFVQRHIPLSNINIELKQGLLYPGNDVPFALVILSSALITGFCEELLFRGVIQPAMIKKTGAVPGIIVTSILFAAFHVNAQEFVSLFLLGLFLGILAYRGGTFIYSALAHLLFNGIAVSSAALNQTGGVGFQGGGISFPLIIAVAVLFIVSMIILFRLTPKRVIGEPDMYYI